MKRRDQAMELVLDLAGPMSPFESIESRDARENEVTADRPEWLFDGLLLFLRDHPDLPHPILWADADVVARQLLAHYKGHPDLVDRLVELLDEPAARESAIDALGDTGDPAAVSHLIGAARRHELNETELVSLACAFGDLGGPQARAALRAMRDDPDLPEPVFAEVELALERSAEP